jgi:hypothetical protein
MVGVLKKYFLDSVLRFSHADFLKAMKLDLGPLLGDVGIWVMTNYANRMKERGKDEKRKKA